MQACQTGGPGAACGPVEGLLRPLTEFLTAASCPKKDFYTPPHPQKSATDFCTAFSKKRHLYCVLTKVLKAGRKNTAFSKKCHLYCVLKKALKSRPKKVRKKSAKKTTKKGRKLS